MIAEELHIFRAGDDNESLAVCKGLVFKYQEKSNVLKIWGPMALEETKTRVPKKDLGPEKVQVGAYYIKHALGSEAFFFDPNDIVIRLTLALTEEGLKRLQKFVFVSCSTAPDATFRDQMKAADISTPWDPAADGSLIFNLLALLDKKGSHPKIGAWDGYISALPLPEGDDKSIYRRPRQAGQALTAEELQQNMGRKIGKGARYGLIVPDYRKQHKHTFQIVEGKVVVDDYSGWKHFS